jgi:hypothetical protein
MLGARETIRFGVSAATAEGSEEQKAESAIMEIEKQAVLHIDFSCFNRNTSKKKSSGQ